MKAVLGIAVCVSLAAAVSAVSGCRLIAKKAAETAIEKTTGVKIDESKDNVTVTGADGTQVTVGDDQKLPDSFPSAIPVYDGAKVTAQMEAAGEGGTMYVVTWTSADEFGTVLDWYKAQLEAKGWKITTTTKTEAGGLIMATMGEKSNLNLGFDPSNEDGAKSVISMTATWAGGK